jgi:antitoxin component YwqK of YwqJK toxin-antitoxin module
MSIKSVNLSTLFMVVFVTLSFAQSNKTTLQKVELYITPRNVEYGWADNGVFQFELNKASVKSRYTHKSYFTMVVKDSVYELFYTKVNMPASFFSNLQPSKENNIREKRILMILPHQDTFYIDSRYNLIKNGRSYELNKQFKSFIENCMPIEIRENWVFDLSRFLETRRTLDDNNYHRIYRNLQVVPTESIDTVPRPYLQNNDTIVSRLIRKKDSISFYSHAIGLDTVLDVHYKFDESFYANGIKKSEATYINEEIYGMARGWYPSGKLFYVFFSQSGHYFGPYLKNYPNGNIQEFGYYKLPTQPTKYQRTVKREGENGYTIYTEYVQLKDGQWNTYYEDGIKKSEETYSQGSRDGLFKYYDVHGYVKKTELYVQDKLIEVKNY